MENVDVDLTKPDVSRDARISSREAESLPDASELYRLLNSDGVDFRERRGFNGYECFDESGRRFPFLVRLVGPDQDPVQVEYSSSKYVELLGDKFAYGLQRVKINNPQKVEVIKQKLSINPNYTQDEKALVAEKVAFDVFVQRLREEDNDRYPFWEYIVGFYDKMDDSMRQKIISFIERLAKAADQGWSFDLPSFPITENQLGLMKNRDNAIVDSDGPVFLDVEAIWLAGKDKGGEMASKLLGLDCQIALELLMNKINLEEAFRRASNEHEEIIASFSK